MGFPPLGGGNKTFSLLGFSYLEKYLYISLLRFLPLGDGNTDMPRAFLDHSTGVETLRYVIYPTRSPLLYFSDFSLLEHMFDVPLLGFLPLRTHTLSYGFPLFKPTGR